VYVRWFVARSYRDSWKYVDNKARRTNVFSPQTRGGGTRYIYLEKRERERRGPSSRWVKEAPLTYDGRKGRRGSDELNYKVTMVEGARWGLDREIVVSVGGILSVNEERYGYGIPCDAGKRRGKHAISAQRRHRTTVALFFDDRPGQGIRARVSRSAQRRL
jgi:hypothetical protein